MEDFKKLPMVLSPDEMEKRKKIRQFLDITKDIESSDGKNFDHKEMEGGIHKGDSAIGSYGLMPNTIKEFANRLRTPELQELSGLSAEEMKKRLESDPALEDRAIQPIATWMLDKHGGDQRAANYAYQYGHNLKPEVVKERMVGSDRDIKFLERYKPIEEKLALEEMAKAVKPKEDNYITKIKSFFTKE